MHKMHKKIGFVSSEKVELPPRGRRRFRQIRAGGQGRRASHRGVQTCAGRILYDGVHTAGVRILGLEGVVKVGVQFAAMLCLVLSSCQPHPAAPQPSIEFTKIPPAAQGGKEKLHTIAGRVVGARPGQHIVIYARSGAWWVQPWGDRPLVAIRPDSTWSSETHLGYEYAALLADPGYRPPPTMDVLPARGGSVVLVKVAKGVGSTVLAPTKPLRFGGYDWRVRTIASDRGGTSNLYDPDNAWTDSNGALHLRIAKKANQWSCAEMVLDRSLGYGTYLLVVRDVSHLEPAAVLSMTTFDEWAGEQYYREMDVEISRWGDPASKHNAQYVIEPYYHPGNVFPFSAPSGTLTHSMRWESGHVTFKTSRGPSTTPGTPAIAEHEFDSGVPSPGQERVHLFSYQVASNKSPLHGTNEVVIEKFEYLP